MNVTAVAMLCNAVRCYLLAVNYYRILLWSEVCIIIRIMRAVVVLLFMKVVI